MQLAQNDLEKIISTVSKVFSLPAENISLETSADDILLWDSLGHMRLILELEQAFSTRIDDRIAITLWSVQALYDYITVNTTK